MSDDPIRKLFTALEDLRKMEQLLQSLGPNSAPEPGHGEEGGYVPIPVVSLPNPEEMLSSVIANVSIGELRPDGRPTFDALYLAVAQVFALAGDCTRRQVGAFIVKDHKPVGMGYNGVEPGRPGCASGGFCPRAHSNAPEYSAYDDCIAIHAEVNAIARSWASLEGATMYVTERPCDSCYKAIRAARIARVVVLQK